MKVRVSILALVVVFCVSGAHAQSGAFAGQVAVNVSLKQPLSSRNAKVGQDVTAALEKPVSIDGAALPKGSILQGHVVDVTKHTKATPNGSLTIVFDHAKPKNGEPVAIRASVYRIALSEDQVLARQRDVDMGMRGTATERNTTSAIRENTDRDNHMVQGMQSVAGAPVQVVSAVPGVALSAVSGEERSGIMTAKNADVELGAGLEMVIGVALKQ